MVAERILKPGWRRVKFGDVVRQVKDKIDPELSGLDRYVAGEHMDTDDLRIRRWGQIGSGYLGPAFHMRFRPGHVLYGSRRTYLRKVAVADFEGICANTTFVIESRDTQVLAQEFLPILMQTEAFHDFSIKNSKGSVNPYINFSDLRDFEFALPPMEEQRRLIAACKAFEEIVEAYELALIALLNYQQSLRETNFGEGITKMQLSDFLSDIQAGKSVVGIDEPPKGKEEKAVLKVSAVGKLAFLPAESKTLIKQNEFLDEHSVHNGDILITRANTPDLVGLVCRVTDDHPNLMLSDKTLRLVPKKDFPGQLLLECLRSRTARQYLKANATGTGGAMKNISQAKLRDMPICLPSQELWEELVLTFDATAAATQEISKRLTQGKILQRQAVQEILMRS